MICRRFIRISAISLGAACILAGAGRLLAEDWPMWGRTPNRNMISPDRNPPTDWDVTSAQTLGQPHKAIWTVDMIAKFGVFPHNMTSSAIAAYQDYIYVITGNGVDDTHKHVVAPQAPGIICFDKNTGKLIWSSNVAGAN